MDRGEFCRATLDEAMAMLKDYPDIDAVDDRGSTLLKNVVNYYGLNREAKGMVEKAELLLKMGADPNKIGGGIFENSPFMDAARNENGTELIRLLLDHGANINLQNKDGATALHEALSRYFHGQPRGTSSNALYLIHAGADVDVQGKNGTTPLMMAVAQAKPDMELIRLLISRSANVNLTNNKGQTALSLAVGGGRAEVLLQLLNAGADLRPDNAGRTPLHHAVKFPEVLVQLIDAGASVDLQDNEGMTALHHASKLGQIKSVETLLTKGATVDLKQKDGSTPLMLACSFGVKEIVQLLINAGADIHGHDVEEKTPLMYASRSLECTKILVKAGAEINARDIELRSPLLWAIKDHSSSVTDFLLKKGSDITVRDKAGKSALFYAVEDWGTENLVHLLDAGAIVDEVDQQGATPLMLSTLNQAEVLLKYNPNLSLQDLNGNTALHQAAKAYSDPEKKLKILLKAGAPLDIQNCDGKTALMLCASHPKAVKLLIGAGANINLTDAEGKSATCFADPESLRLLIQAEAVPNAFESLNLQKALHDDDLPLAILLMERGIKAGVSFGFYTHIKKTIAKIAQTKADLLQQAIECKDDDTLEEMSKLLGKYKEQAEQANEDELPPVLKPGGWPVVNSERKPIVISLERFSVLTGHSPRLVMDDKTREKCLALHRIVKPREGEDDTKLQAAIDKFLKKKSSDVKFTLLVRASDELLLSVWNKYAAKLIGSLAMSGDYWGGSSFDTEDLKYVLARLGLDGLPGVLAAIKKKSGLASVLQTVDSADCAFPISMLMDGTQAPFAKKWMLDFSGSAIHGLLPVALGNPGKERNSAEAALRFLSRQGHEIEIKKLAAEVGNDAVDALMEILSQDADSDFIPEKLPPIPSFWSSETYPAPRFKANGKSLPPVAINSLARMMAAASMEHRPSVIDEIKDLCEPRSLAEFAWAAFEDWAAKGDKESDWIFSALSYFGDDVCARKLTPYIREWPRNNGTPRAKMGLEILAAIGSDVALAQIQAVAQKNKYAPVLEHAKLMIDKIAKERSLTAAELEDILVPTLGLPEDGIMKIDFGSRKFTGSVDTVLKPVLRDETGAILKALPAIGKSDNKTLAEEQAAVWSELCKDLKPVAKLQLERFELGMINSRRWPGNTFTGLMIPHPLLRELVRGLVWGIFSKRKLVQPFCLDESGRTVDLTGAPVKIADNASIGVVHPLLLGSDVEAWKKNFSTRKQAQPFAQLPRRAYRRDEDANQDCFGLNGATVPSKALKGLKAMGWGHEIGDAGWIWGFHKKGCSLGAEPGVHISDYEWGGATEQKLEVTLATNLDEIEYSEIVRELQTLRK